MREAATVQPESYSITDGLCLSVLVSLRSGRVGGYCGKARGHLDGNRRNSTVHRKHAAARAWIGRSLSAVGKHYNYNHWHSYNVI